MKTPEQMAEEYANNGGELEDTYIWRAERDGFLAGYQAAKNHYTGKDQPETLAEIGSSFARQKTEKFYQGFIRGKRR